MNYIPRSSTCPTSASPPTSGATSAPSRCTSAPTTCQKWKAETERKGCAWSESPGSSEGRKFFAAGAGYYSRHSPPHFNFTLCLLHTYIHIDKLRRAADGNVQRYAVVSSDRGSTAAATPTAATSTGSVAIPAATRDCSGDCNERDEACQY